MERNLVGFAKVFMGLVIVVVSILAIVKGLGLFGLIFMFVALIFLLNNGGLE